jgi:hypothetical protein
MTGHHLLGLLMTGLAIAALAGATPLSGSAQLLAAGQDRQGAAARIVGVWALNHDLSDDPRRNPPATDSRGGDSDGGFGPRAGGGFGGGGFGGFGGGRGSGGRTAGPPARSPEDVEALREAVVRFLETAERITIVEADGAVLLTDDDGRTQTLRPDGRKRDQKAANGLVSLTRKTAWNGANLVSELDIEDGPTIILSYGRSEGGSQLVITATVKNGRGDPMEFRRVYDPADLGFI